MSTKPVSILAMAAVASLVLISQAYTDVGGGLNTPAAGDAVTTMLREFEAAVSALDADKAQKLFLTPDDTPDGKNRRKHIDEMRKDWSRAKEKGEKVAVEFKNAVILVRAEMFPGGAKAEAKAIPVEFKVKLTRDGCRILAMEYFKK